jgi:hypothetical protein
VLLVAWVGVPYLLLQRVDWRPVTVLEWDPWTRALPFLESSVWVYLSMYPFLAWAALGCREEDFPRFVGSCALTALVAHLVFLTFPTWVPRPVVGEPGWLYGWLRSVDMPRNALPSLHAGLSLIGAIVLWSRYRGPLGWLAAGWAGAIVVSTLTLRQHVVVDAVAGMGLAAGCWVVVGRAGMCRT